MMRRIHHSAALGVAGCALLLTASARSALAQTEPKSMRLEGAPSQTGTGALRCVPNESVQLGLRALDENLNRTLVADYAPQARSTDERVVVARVSDNAASTVNVLCVGDGEAWITVEAAGLRADMPVLVGTARRKATPTGPHPELAGAASTATVSQVAPTSTAPAAVPTVGTARSAVGIAPTQSTAATTTTATRTEMPISTAPTSPVRAIGGPLAAPTGVTATPFGNGQVKLTWNAVPEAALYHVLYHKVGETQWYALTDRPGDPVPSVPYYQSDPNKVVLPAGPIEFTVYGARDAADVTGQRSTPVRMGAPQVLGNPSLPSPKFQIVGFSRSYSAQNDPMVNTVRLASTPPADWKSCPYTPMIHWSQGQPAVPAAPHNVGQSTSDATYDKYVVVGDAVYFRNPVIPGQVLVQHPEVNARLYLVNCRNEYSNALDYTIEPPEPTTFQITTVYPEKIAPGAKVAISGFALAAWDTTSQKVYFHFKLAKTNAAGTGQDEAQREVPAGYANASDSYSAWVFAPALEGLGYDRQWVILEASLYVVKSGLRSNSIPIRYCSSSNGPLPGSGVSC